MLDFRNFLWGKFQVTDLAKQGDVYSFGQFKADVSRGELVKAGVKLRLQEKPFRLLAILLDSPNEIVSREELRNRLWPADTFVEFDDGLNAAVKKLRIALGDSADEPRFVETVPRRGYRFIAPVRQATPSHIEGPSLIPGRAPLEALLHRIHPRWWVALATAGAVFALIATGVSLRARTSTTRAARKPDRILIGGFSNTTANSGLDSALRTGLRLSLSESPYVDLVSDKGLLMAMKATGDTSLSQLSTEGALVVCRKLEANLILEGTVTSAPNEQYNVRLQATGCLDGRVVAAEQSLAHGQNDLLPAVGRAADTLRQRLGESETSLGSFHTPIEASTSSLAALKLFADAEEQRAKGADYATIALYQTATDLDPKFALAYARLGIIYYNAQELETSRRFFSKAFELREHANERERLYITAHYYGGSGKTDKLLAVYELWRQLYPLDLVPANNLADVYFDLGQTQKAVDTAREAVRLGPDNAFPYAALVRAYRRAGQFQEAKKVYDEALARNLDTIVSHIERYIIGFAEHDQVAMQSQIEWAKGKPQENEIVNEAAIAALGRGQLRYAKQLFREAAKIGLQNGMPQFAGTCSREYAEFAADVGIVDAARSTMDKALRSEPDSREFLASAALVFANTGDLRRADQLALQAEQKSVADFQMTKIVLPTARAAGQLHRHNPESALHELQVVEPYDLSWKTELASIYYRGLAYMQLRRFPEARRQFQKILDNWASRPEAAYIPLAHLGLGRSFALEGNTSAARAEYEQLFEIWKEADPDIPVLKQAKTEYANLR
jgi:pentatricopeptide repeat protein